MCHKRFLKILLIVLALALWASTAYGQALTLSPSASLTFNYTQFATAPSTQAITFTVTDNSVNSSHPFIPPDVSAQQWLTMTGCNSVSLVGDPVPANVVTATCTFGLNKAWFDSHAISVAPSSFEPTVDGSLDATSAVLIEVAFTPAPVTLTSSSSTIALGNYAVNSNNVVTRNLSISSNDDSGGAATAYTASTTCAWLTLLSTSTSSATGGTVASSVASDTLRLTVNTATANAATLGLQTACNVVITKTVGGTAVATAPVTLTVTPPVYTASPTYTKTATYVKDSGAAGQITGQQTVTVSSYTASPADAYSVVPNSCPAWISIANAGTASSTVPDSLVLGIDHVAADKIAPGSVSCSLAINYAATLVATVNFTLTITGTTTTWMAADQTAPSVIYTLGGGASQAAATTTIHVSSEDTIADNYTWAKTSCPAWLDVVSSGTASVSTPGTTAVQDRPHV